MSTTGRAGADFKAGDPDDQSGGDGANADVQQGDQPDNNAGSGVPDGSDHDQAPQVTVADAKVSIASIVQSFISAHSTDGAWALRDKATGQVRQLSLKSVDENTTQQAGQQRFKVAAKLKDLDSGEILPAEFVADFSTPEWKIVGMRLVEPGKKKARRAANASPAS